MGGPTFRRVAAIDAAALLFAALAAWAANETTPAQKRTTSPDQAKLFMVRQQIDAELSTIDQSRKSLTLTTNAGKCRLEAAPAVPAYFKTGDRVVLEVGILASAHPDSLPQRRAAREGTDPGAVRQHLDARVVRADVNSGVLTVKTAAGTLKVDLPSGLIAAFQRADVVPVELAVIPAPSLQASPLTDPEHGRRAGLAALLLAIFGKNKR
jgi:hypothetical protein